MFLTAIQYDSSFSATLAAGLVSAVSCNMRELQTRQSRDFLVNASGLYNRFFSRRP